LKYEYNQSIECVEALCRACAQGQYDEIVWATIKSRLEEIHPALTPVDSAIVLKSIMLYCTQAPEETEGFSLIAFELIRKLSSPRLPAKSVGNYTILYTLQGLNMFGNFMDEKETVDKYINILLKRLVNGERLEKIAIPGIVNIVQALTPRIGGDINCSYIESILEECTKRVDPTEMVDVDVVFGMISSVSKFFSILPKSVKKILDKSKTLLLDQNVPFLHTLTPEQLVGTVHAFSRLGPAAVTGTLDLFTAIGNRLVARYSEEDIDWTPRMVSVCLNSYGTAAVLHGDLMDTIGRKVLPNIVSELQPAQTTMCMHAISRLGLLGRRNFTKLLVHASNQVQSMNMHSVSKLVVSLLDVPGSEEHGRHLLTSCLERLCHLSNSSIGPISRDDFDSLLFAASAVAKSSGNMDNIGPILLCISRNMASQEGEKNIGMIAKISSEFSVSQQTPIDALRQYNESVMSAIVGGHWPSISLADLAKCMHACAAADMVEKNILLSMIRSRSLDIRRLTFRPLTRLNVALSKCGIVDEDLTEAIRERMAELVEHKNRPGFQNSQRKKNSL
jgi:hypothetical protein